MLIWWNINKINQRQKDKFEIDICLKKNKEKIDNDNILSYLQKKCVVAHDYNKINYKDDYNLINTEYYARIKRYIETCKKININSHSTSLRLLEENPYTKKMKISEKKLSIF